jgi:hypothetical protein
MPLKEGKRNSEGKRERESAIERRKERERKEVLNPQEDEEWFF